VLLELTFPPSPAPATILLKERQRSSNDSCPSLTPNQSPALHVGREEIWTPVVLEESARDEPWAFENVFCWGKSPVAKNAENTKMYSETLRFLAAHEGRP